MTLKEANERLAAIEKQLHELYNERRALWDFVWRQPVDDPAKLRQKVN
jgi:hypothetical protein